MNRILRKEDFFAVSRLPLASICGIDEAGRGPLAGPVCAAAVILSEDFPVEILNDSKALSEKKRELAYRLITDRALDWAVAWASWEEIGALNILHASLLAMKRAYKALRMVPLTVFVDGNRPPDLGRPCTALIGGDALQPSIMAASILAKVARDTMMLRLDAIQPEYRFCRHKGYPTQKHREAIKKFGPSLWERPGFALR